MGDERALARRRWRILVLFGMVLALGYPLLLDASTGAGLSLGLRHDVNAQRELLRALNYAGDRDVAVDFGSDVGQPLIIPLDAAALGRELGDPLLASSGITPAPGVAVATSPTVTPTSPASAAPAGPPPAVAPPGPCPGAPTGGIHLNLRARDATGGGIAGARVGIYYQGCLVASGTTNSAGRVTNVSNLAPNSTYTYVVSASGYQDATGSFNTQGNNNISVDVVMTPR
ncbi:MAG: carboxypeptidase-like regulatory domain-containing protein [Candidatus Dormibacteria bacterium]